MRSVILLLSLLFCTYLSSQYYTPGTGVVWNMDSLVANSGGLVTFETVDQYQVNGELHISENDSLVIDGQIISVAPGQIFYIEGSINMDGDPSILSGIIGGNIPFGLRLEESANGFFRNVTFQFFGGIKVLTANFHMEDCQLYEAFTSVTTGGAVEITQGKPVFLNNSFAWSDVSAISSAANAEVAPIIDGNSFNSNVETNTNRPQINLGPSGSADTTMIINNSIIGSLENEMAGGIAVSSLLGGAGNVVIEGNTITNNRYGIAIVGNGLYARIDNNIIHDNNTQNEPFLGGSGINLNGNSTSFAIVAKNDIRGNLWGITMQGSFLANLGDDVDNIDSPGENVFAENGNGGQLYALFNNTPNEVPAKFNCWDDNVEELTLEISESVISHEIDDPELGEVFFDPLGECTPVGLSEQGGLTELIELYPNPANDFVNISWPVELDLESYVIVSTRGRIVVEVTSLNTLEVISIKDLAPGIYYIMFQSKNGIITKKLVRS